MEKIIIIKQENKIIEKPTGNNWFKNSLISLSGRGGVNGIDFFQ